MEFLNLKTVALAAFLIGSHQIFAKQEIPSVGKRLTAIVEHSVYATVTGASAGIIGLRPRSFARSKWYHWPF